MSIYELNPMNEVQWAAYEEAMLESEAAQRSLVYENEVFNDVQSYINRRLP